MPPPSISHRTAPPHTQMLFGRRCFIAVATSSFALTSTPVAASVLIAARTRASTAFRNRAVSLLATQVSSTSSSSTRQFSTTKMATP